MAQPTRRFVRWRRGIAIAWAAIVGAFVAVILASYRAEVGWVANAGDLYGVRLNAGEIQVFHGRRFGGPTPQATAARIPWHSIDATDQPSFNTPHFTTTLSEMRSPVPFRPVRSAYTWSQRAADGTTTYVGFGRELWAASGPAWLIALVAASVYWWPTVFARLRRKGRAGFCPACGYDLRASPDRCPECGGTAPATVPS